MSSPDRTHDGFEERLLVALKDMVAERSAPARRPARRRLVYAAALAVAAVAGATAIGLHDGPAYAVERDRDGSIRIYIHDYRDPEGLQRRLASFGVRAAVDYLPAGRTCQEPRADFVPQAEVPLGLVNWGPFPGGEKYFKVYPRFIGPGQTFVYTAQVGWDAHGNHFQRAVIRLANGPVAPCRQVPGDLLPGR